MKYIRAEDKIIDITGKKIVSSYYGMKPDEVCITCKYKQADTIEELIMHDDLVECDGIYYSRIEKDRGDYFVGYDKRVLEKNLITALYVARGKDVEIEVEKWILVARKNEKGELELL